MRNYLVRLHLVLHACPSSSFSSCSNLPACCFPSQSLYAFLRLSPASNSGMDWREVSQDISDQLTRFAQFSSLSYIPTCGNPLGKTLVQTINNAVTDTNKQIIVAFRGSLSIQDFFIDAQVALTPLDSQDVTNTSNSAVHSGFLSAYNSVSSDVISAVSSELDAHKDHVLVSTDHSLGGALAGIAGISLAANFPDVPLQVFTFDQPRTGNAEYAQLVEDFIGTENFFRAVHTTSECFHIHSATESKDVCTAQMVCLPLSLHRLAINTMQRNIGSSEIPVS
ncbi:hypothetical protein ACEPAH_1357 [Sanghuangporus vaninii]